MQKHPRREGALELCLVALLARGGYGQQFSSGSTGADGPLTLNTPGVVLFDPTPFIPPLDPAGDNIFNFTTINIASGVTLRLSGNKLTGPVYFLATGAVQINGTIDLSGDTGYQITNYLSARVPAAGGAGGYAGGVGGNGLSGTFPQKSGNGPGGGIARNSNVGVGGRFTGSVYLIPLIGGSGGAGDLPDTTGCGPGTYGSGGGGGGGALLIASSTSITVSGTINADGGHGGCDAGNGGGGAVRLMAPSINGNGIITARGYPGPSGYGADAGNGLIKLEAFQQNYAGSFNSTPVSQSSPFKVALPATPPSSVRVTSIAGIPINANPFSFPDAVINSSSPVPITIEAHFVPVGTVPQVVILPENVGDLLVTAPALQGTFQLSTSTVNVTLPAGGLRGYVKTTW